MFSHTHTEMIKMINRDELWSQAAEHLIKQAPIVISNDVVFGDFIRALIFIISSCEQLKQEIVQVRSTSRSSL